MSDVLSQLNGVFQDVFDDDELSVSPETTAQDVEGWDSLMHVTLMVNVERAFGIRFTSSEVAALKNVGELVDLIERRAGSQSHAVPR
jgi:acyl carrier protein